MFSKEHLAFLERINPLEVIEKISKFRSLNIAMMTPAAIDKAIYDALTFEDQFIYLSNISTYPKGTLFFRARKLDNSVLPNTELM